jgi:hypothetical protein
MTGRPGAAHVQSDRPGPGGIRFNILPVLSLTLKSPGSGDSHLLRPGPPIIGRAPDPGILVHHESASRRAGEPPSTVESMGSVEGRDRTAALEAVRLPTC